jgi:hypothetical protein
MLTRRQANALVKSYVEERCRLATSRSDLPTRDEILIFAASHGVTPAQVAVALDQLDLVRYGAHLSTRPIAE